MSSQTASRNNQHWQLDFQSVPRRKQNGWARNGNAFRKWDLSMTTYSFFLSASKYFVCRVSLSFLSFWFCPAEGTKSVALEMEF